MDGIASLFHQHPLPAYAVLALFIYGFSYSVRYVVESRSGKKK